MSPIRPATPRLFLIPVVGLLGVVGCFNPEEPDMDAYTMDELEEEEGEEDVEEEEEQDEGDACLPTGDACGSPVECCGYEGTGEVGDALCSGFGGDYRCTNVCHAQSDCIEGCCIALAGVSDHGSCDSCAGVPFGSDMAVCLAGVAMLCGCLEGSTTECTEADHAAFEASCADPTSEDGQVFVCMGNANSCGEAADLCIPE